MVCVKCGSTDEDSIFSEHQIDTYTVWVIRKDQATGKLYPVDMSAALCHSCLKERRMQHAKASLFVWLIVSAVFFLAVCAVIGLLSGGDGSLNTLLTFPSILIPLLFFLMTPFVFWIRYHRATPRSLIARIMIGKDWKTWEQLGYLVGVYDRKPVGIVQNLGFVENTYVKFEGDQ